MGIITTKHSISELNGDGLFKEVTLQKLKKNVQILVIDDDEFTYLNSLQNNDYCIKQRNDIASLGDVSEYDIILCDVRGVGKFLNSEFEGAYLAKQIKEKYPNKIVVSYTASNYDANFQKFLNRSDSIIPKGTSLEDWDSLLLKFIKDYANPVKQWEKTRDALLKAGVSTFEVANYESKYVRAYKKGEITSLKDEYNKKSFVGKEILVCLLELISTIVKLKVG